jgi:3',5'-cyclic AMP phosphodiesterase CpdA
MDPGVDEVIMPGNRSRGWFKNSLAFIFLIACLAPAVWGDSGLPARDWNLRNLKRIEALKPGTLVFAVLGDNRGNLPVFDALLKQMARDPGLEFAVHLGDMVETGDFKNYRDFFQAVRQYLKMPLLAVIGNHELSGDPTGKLYTEIFGPRYFSFQLHGHYFIMVDDSEKTGPDEAQRRWLEAELKKSQACKTRLVFLHVPLFDPRGGDHHHSLPPENGRRLAALFRQYRVTHIFAGHIHSSFDGQWDGVPYTISAGAGAPLYGRDPAHFFFHYLKVMVKGDKVQVQMRQLEKAGRP